METKLRSNASSSCSKQTQSLVANGAGVQVEDRLIELPEHIRVSILSSLTTKEGVMLSLVSHEWANKLWAIFPVLIFEQDPEVIKRMHNNQVVSEQETSTFIKQVNNVVQNHRGQIIDKFRIKFRLDETSQLHVDKWVDFALRKQVKRLELDLFSYLGPDQCTLSLEHFRPPHVWTALTSLYLDSVSLTTKGVEFLLRSCTFLGDLFIGYPKGLSSVTVSGNVSLCLKHLTVRYCGEMRSIDICVPELESFTYYGQPIELHLRNASSLTKISIPSPPASVFDSIPQCLSQLEYLKLQIHLASESCLGIGHLPAMTKLKHLELDVTGTHDQTARGWMPLIEASPSLRNLTLKISSACFFRRPEIPLDIVYNDGQPLKFLKTIEIYGFVGCRLDFELASHVVKNAIFLRNVIVHLDSVVRHEDKRDARKCATQLGKSSLLGTKVTIKET